MHLFNNTIFEITSELEHVIDVFALIYQYSSRLLFTETHVQNNCGCIVHGMLCHDGCDCLSWDNLEKK